MTLESIKAHEKDNELYLSDLFKTIFNHFIMIGLCALCFAIIFFAVGKIMPEKRNASVIVQIKNQNANSILSKYGYEYYTPSSFCYDVLEIENLMSTYNSLKEDDGKKSPIYEDLRKFIGYSDISGPLSQVKFYANETDKPEFYIDVLETAIKKTAAKTTEEAIINYELCKNDIQTRLTKERQTVYTNLIDQRNQQDRVKSYEQELMNLDIYRKNIENPIEFIDSRISEKKIGTSGLMYAIMGFLLGGITGCIIAFSIDFTDKRIYSISQSYRMFDPEDIISSIPLYKDGLKEDSLDMDYLASKLSDKGKNVLVTSLSDRAGKTTISKALSKKMGKDSSVVDGSTITANPEMLQRAQNANVTLLIVKAGHDKSTTLISTLRDMLSIGTKNIYIILNGIEHKDKYLNLYEDKSKYKNFVWILNTWQHFYKKNAF